MAFLFVYSTLLSTIVNNIDLYMQVRKIAMELKLYEIFPVSSVDLKELMDPPH